MAWQEEYWRSIKSLDTEEKLDLYFYRPLGFLIAKAALPTFITPTMLTVAGLIFGLSSGYFFFHNQSNSSLILASALFILAGIFDSSDGQLARMGGKSTKLGLVLDGLCDNLVFAAVYIGSALTVFYIWGHWLWPILLLAGACHSFQSSMLDYYNREYLIFGCGKSADDYWNPTIAEAKHQRDFAPEGERIIWKLRYSWLWQQNKLSSRSDSDRFRWKGLSEGPSAKNFQALYREHNQLILRFWRLMGPNFHTILILIFVFLRRFDLYLILGDIFLLTAALFALRAWQRKKDACLNEALRQKGLLG